MASVRGRSNRASVVKPSATPNDDARKRKVGRPRLEWNPDTIFALGVVQATLDEIASACKVSAATVDRWNRNPDFDAALKAGKAEGCLSLRRRLLLSDAPACMIFSAKNLLGWTDKQDVTSGGEKLPAINVVLAIPDEDKSTSAT